MPKIKIFIWQICHNVLLVRGIVLRRGLVINPACPLCLGDIESIEHIFKDCQMVHKVWNLAAKHSWFRDGSYTRIRKIRPEPAPFIVGMGMENWKKNGYGAGMLKMGMGIGITRPIPVPASYPNFF